VTAAGYGLTTVLGRVFLHEQVSASRWWGVVLISLGTGLAAGTAGEATIHKAKRAVGGAQ
jgi:drug/metabolite transporter (DMT)-like permease